MKCDIQMICTASDVPASKDFKKVLALLSDRFALKKQSLTIRIVKTAESQYLNKTYRGKDKATNVLSFQGDFHLGDLVLCHEVIIKEALEQHKSLENHYTHLIIHGVLHLLGYDHENENDACEMEALEIDLLKTLDINNPYEEHFHGA